MISSLIINTANHIYLCTYEDESQIIGRLYAFDADGTIRWVYKCSSIFWYDPVISREGIICAGQNVNSKLYAFSPDGELLWEKRMGQGEGHRPLSEIRMGLCIGVFLASYMPLLRMAK